MSTEQIAPSEKLFQSYLKSPFLAMPTVIIFFLVMGGMFNVWVYALAGTLPMWAGALINGILSYWLFSIIHDASHHSLSSNKLINETVGGIGLFFLFPYAPMIAWILTSSNITHLGGRCLFDGPALMHTTYTTSLSMVVRLLNEI